MLLLSADGWAIEEVKHCTFAGMAEGGNGVFQVIVVATEVQGSLADDDLGRPFETSSEVVDEDRDAEKGEG